MARKRGHAATWMEVAVTNAGIRKGISALGWAYAWGVARQSIGHDPSVEEVADWWRQTHRTAYRNQAAFRKAFPTLENPSRIFQQPEIQERLAEAARLGDKMDPQNAGEAKVPDLEIVRIGMFTASL
jgi:hypothetical protein